MSMLTQQVKPLEVGVRVRSGPLPKQISSSMQVLNAIAVFGLLLAKLITKVVYKLVPWLRPDVVSESVSLDEWHRDEIDDWDRKFFRKTGRSVKKILNPPPPKPSDYHVLVACTCPDCTGVKKPKTKLIRDLI